MILIDDEFKQLFLNKLETLITTGESIVHHKSLQSETVIKNSDNEIIRTSKTIKNERNTTVLPTPPYVMQMIDRHLSLNEAISTCQQAGYIVIDPTRIENDDNAENSQGLSEFAVSEISAKLLGIDM